MTDIKFIGTNQVELVNSLSENKISPTQVGENFIEFSFNSLSKDSDDFYHFVITGSNVEVSGQITEVHNDYQFFNLFAGCEEITDAGQLILSAPTAKKFCYANMFLDCTNLTSPPQIQASTLDEWCYSSMFGNCSSLTAVPTLSATTLAPYCYYCMFYGCKSLSSAPYLPAQTLQDWCYNSMFYECENLTSISANFNSWGENATTNWVTGIETLGVFWNDNVTEIHGVDNIPVTWTFNEEQKDHLTFTAINNNSKIVLNQVGTPSSVNINYRKNNGTWSTYNFGDQINLRTGEFVAFSGNNDHFNSGSGEDYYRFAMTGMFKASGNIMSLMNFTDTCKQNCFFQLFRNCSGLITPPELPANLASGCYQGLFFNCSSLSTAPVLSATTLVPNCYTDMFRNCKSLLDAPELPATILADNCYSSMFALCNSLTGVPDLSATTLAPKSCFDMFRACTSLSTAPQLPAETLAPSCYYYMFQGCTSLLDAPELPATTLADWCYMQMFQNCTSLTGMESLPATTLADNCCRSMFHNCTSLTTAPQLLATELAEGCYFSMFQGCTSLLDAPELPATTLKNNCYHQMFYGCTSLSSINVDFIDWGNNKGTGWWVQHVASTGVFTKPSVLAEEYGVNKIPVNTSTKWTVVNK